MFFFLYVEGVCVFHVYWQLVDGVSVQNYDSTQLGYFLFNWAGKNCFGLAVIIWAIFVPFGEFPPIKKIGNIPVSSAADWAASVLMPMIDMIAVHAVLWKVLVGGS